VERGDVFHVDLNPIQGREQAGARYVVIVSPKAFNVLGTPLVCPITQGGNFARHAGFAVSPYRLNSISSLNASSEL
jgi:mRNA interferase ChpB